MTPASRRRRAGVSFSNFRNFSHLAIFQKLAIRLFCILPKSFAPRRNPTGPVNKRPPHSIHPPPFPLRHSVCCLRLPLNHPPQRSSGAAQTMNQILEVEYDKLMNRTRGRPLPRGRVSTEHAAVFSTVSGMSGASLLALGTTPATAVLGTSIAALYAGLYTPMKRVTPYNTHVGAIAGSLPVLMGFAAAGAPIYCPQAIMLFALQTLWQFPHFYCLAWLHRADYSKANYKMFPLGDETGKYTANIIKPYNAALMALPTVSCAVGATTWMFAVDSIIPNVFFAQRFMAFSKDPSPATARSFFFASLWYL